MDSIILRTYNRCSSLIQEKRELERDYSNRLSELNSEYEVKLKHLASELEKELKKLGDICKDIDILLSTLKCSECDGVGINRVDYGKNTIEYSTCKECKGRGYIL